MVHFLADSVVDPEVGEVHGTVVELEASASIDVNRAGFVAAGKSLNERRSSEYFRLFQNHGEGRY